MTVLACCMGVCVVDVESSSRKIIENKMVQNCPLQQVTANGCVCGTIIWSGPKTEIMDEGHR